MRKRRIVKTSVCVEGERGECPAKTDGREARGEENVGKKVVANGISSEERSCKIRTENHTV